MASTTYAGVDAAVLRQGQREIRLGRITGVPPGHAVLIGTARTSACSRAGQLATRLARPPPDPVCGRRPPARTPSRCRPHRRYDTPAGSAASTAGLCGGRRWPHLIPGIGPQETRPHRARATEVTDHPRPLGTDRRRRGEPPDISGVGIGEVGPPQKVRPNRRRLSLDPSRHAVIFADRGGTGPVRPQNT